MINFLYNLNYRRKIAIPDILITLIKQELRVTFISIRFGQMGAEAIVLQYDVIRKCRFCARLDSSQVWP